MFALDARIAREPVGCPGHNAEFFPERIALDEITRLACLVGTARRAFVLAVDKLRGANRRRTSKAANHPTERRLRQSIAMRALNRARTTLIRAEKALADAQARLAAVH